MVDDTVKCHIIDWVLNRDSTGYTPKQGEGGGWWWWSSLTSFFTCVKGVGGMRAVFNGPVLSGERKRGGGVEAGLGKGG